MTVPGGYVALDTLTAANMNLLPGGVVARVSKTTSQTGITAEADLTSMTVTWTAVSSRLYKITAQVDGESDAAGDSIRLYLTTSANTVIQASIVEATSVSAAETMHLVAYESSLSGSTTRKLRFADIGGGTAAVTASATHPLILIVEDIGPA